MLWRSGTRSSFSCNSWFSPLYKNSPVCLGSSESFLPSALSPPPLLSLHLPVLCRVGPAFMQHHQRATIVQLFWQGGIFSPQTLANPPAKTWGKRGSAGVQDGLRRAGTEFPLPRSHCSSEGVTALEKSYKQDYNDWSEGTWPGKPLDSERFACGCKGLPVPAACLPLGLQSWTRTSNLLCFICFVASTPSMENINSILFKLFFCPELTKAHALIFKVWHLRLLKGQNRRWCCRANMF